MRREVVLFNPLWLSANISILIEKGELMPQTPCSA